MKGELYQEHLGFFQEAKKAFENDPKLETYRDTNDKFIALRYGEDKDCINVFKLDEQIAFLHNVIDPVKNKRFFEVYDPYYALIQANNLLSAHNLYVAYVSEVNGPEINEVTFEHAVRKYRGSPKNCKLSYNEAVEEIQENLNGVLLIDGCLLP